ncbi:MAG: NAD-binding protein [Hyphomicrobiales bacterium]|nr:MAG: NAD-binding protein [Hyphomicrobiales bacterium]
MEPVRWGILSTARIGLDQVIPAMMQSELCDIRAIASRDRSRGQAAAERLGIPKAYDSYAGLLADPDIEAIYNPLPNHLHVPLSIEALAAGKHVLCEKPIGLNAAETADLLAARDQGDRLIVEAFMVRHHPQWQRAREILRSGEIGPLRLIQSTFSFFNDNPRDIRNRPETGGGALYDIGVYPITAARYFLASEPKRVFGAIRQDPDFGTDILTSGMMEFEDAMAVFTVSTQMVPYQRLHLFAAKGRIEIRIPYNAPSDAETRIYLDDGSGLGDVSARSETIAPCDQYRLQAERFGRCVRGLETPEFPLEDSLAQMRLVDAIFASARSGQWIDMPA